MSFFVRFVFVTDGIDLSEEKKICLCPLLNNEDEILVLLKMGRVKHHQSRRNYHQNKSSPSAHSNSIQLGQHGIFVSFCSTKESFVRNEVYNLLNRFADQLFGGEFGEEEQQVDTADLHDLDSALENEKSKLTDTKKKIRRFQIVKSGANHSFFVSTTLPLSSLNQLIESIFQTSIDSKEQHSRYIERLMPVLFICKAYEDELRKLIIEEEFLKQILSLIDPTVDTIWFDVQAKKSNNTQLKSSQLEEIVINDLHSRKTEDLNGKTFKRDYKKPVIHILLHVIKNVILISIVRHYDSYKKYNLASINLVTTTEQQEQKKITFHDDEDEVEE